MCIVLLSGDRIWLLVSIQFHRDLLTAFFMSQSCPCVTIRIHEAGAAIRTFYPSVRVRGSVHRWRIVGEIGFSFASDSVSITSRTFNPSDDIRTVVFASFSGAVTSRAILQNDGIVIVLVCELRVGTPRILRDCQAATDFGFTSFGVHF